MAQRRAGRQRWVIAGLAIYGLAVVVILLAPVSYSGIVNAISAWLAKDLGLSWFGSGWIEFGANIVMFMPVGFLLTLLLRHHWLGVLLALAISAGAELAQIFIPSRDPSLRDVLANTLGAAIGAGIAWLAVLRRDARAGSDEAEARAAAQPGEGAVSADA